MRRMIDGCKAVMYGAAIVVMVAGMIGVVWLAVRYQQWLFHRFEF